MAVIKADKTTKPTTINRFLGLNLSDTGDTQIQLGESGNMTNFYITDDLKLRKAHGYKSFHRYFHTETQIIDGVEQEVEVGDNVRGMFSTKIGNTQYLLVAVNGKLYYFLQSQLDDEENWDNITPVEIGSIPDNDTSFFEFDNKVYILCGGYYKWDGTTLNKVEGYTPTVFINTPAGINGGGIIYEEINMLSPKKKQTFNGDGEATTPTRQFKIAQAVDRISYDSEHPNDSYIVSVRVDKSDTPLTPGTDYDFYVEGNNTHKDIIELKSTVSFKTGYDNVEITWSKDDGDRDIIEGMKFGTIFGGDVDTRVFLYGNQSCQNRVYYSAISYANGIAVPSVEYFPATAQVDIGPKNFAVTDLTRQYDRLLATTNKPEAYYLTISTEQLQVTLVDNSSTTRYVPAVSTFPLNESHGNVAMGQGRLLNNYPVTFENGEIIQWKATNVRDEKNMEGISAKIKKDLDKITMSGVKTLDFQEYNQLWIVYDDTVWIYNYYNQTYSRLKLQVSVNNITSLNGNVYISATDGNIIKFSRNFNTFDGETINSYWEMNFSDFGVPYLRKTMNRLWVQMQPSSFASADISFISNRAESQITKHIEYKKQWFDEVHFDDWHFTASINPQPFKIKLKAKKFTNLKLTIKNEENSTCTILSLVLQVESFGYSK